MAAPPNDGDAEAGLPRLSGPIPMPLPVSPLAAYTDSEAVREEALQPTVAHSLLRRPDAATLMAMPYQSQAAQTEEPPPLPTARLSESVGEGDVPQARVRNAGALARPVGQRAEELAFDTQVNSTDLNWPTVPMDTGVLPAERKPAAIARNAELAMLREWRDEEAPRKAEEPGLAAGTLPRSGAIARQPDISQTLARPAQSLQDEPEGDAWQAPAEERQPIMERVRTFLPREANPDRAPMPLARTGMPGAGSRPQLMTLDGAPGQTEIPMNSSGEVVHRQVVVQRAETGESPGGGEGGGQQGQAGGHNAEQEHGKQGDEGAASGDVNLLANEVYGLIKRRLAQEAERMGRSK